MLCFFFFQAEDGIRDYKVTGVQTCALPIYGLSRLSIANQQRWATLAVSALGVNLPRLALLLRGIGDESALVLSRDARSDVARMFGRMAQAHALCTALGEGGKNPRPALVGLHRQPH